MKKFVVEQNIERYRRLLEREADPRRRAVLERLLAEEQQNRDRLRADADSGGQNEARDERSSS